MKVLQPLFLDELHEAYEKAKDSVPKLEALLGRLSKIRVFDPACGSGNFLIISYKALRHLEMRILIRIGEIAPKAPLRLSGISLQHFYGVDVVDFACETAKLSMWIAEHQMNCAFKDQFGLSRPTLPLGKIATIHNGNSLRLDWRDVCPPGHAFETYICGNPPYHGTKYQTASEKDDLAFVFSPITPKYRLLDYIGGWFLKASKYIEGTRVKAAFVSTNSICQGEIVPALWPLLFASNIEIAFASTSFKWENNASNNAGVSCVIIGLQSMSSSEKHLFNGSHGRRVPHIGPYLIPAASNIVVQSATNPTTARPIMMRGAAPTDDGHLLFTSSERAALLDAHPEAEPLFRRVYGTQEFLHSIERWTVWITDDDLPLAQSIPAIAKRLKAVKAYRLLSPKAATKASATFPHRFQEIRATGDGIFVPHTFSELRRYITVGTITAHDVVLAPAFGLYNPPTYILAILSSRLHLLWLETVGGKLENRLRYSNTLIYNTFPVPVLSDEQKRILSDRSKAILKARANHPGKTIAELYDPANMPANLSEAHQENDAYLEEYVYGRSFKDDTHRLEHLFSMYATVRAREDTPLLAPTKFAGSPRR